MLLKVESLLAVGLGFAGLVIMVLAPATIIGDSLVFVAGLSAIAFGLTLRRQRR